MKFKDMPYKRVDYDKTAEQFKTLTKRVKEAAEKNSGRSIRNIIRFIRI
mgnify:CR=1 FL=1